MPKHWKCGGKKGFAAARKFKKLTKQANCSVLRLKTCGYQFSGVDYVPGFAHFPELLITKSEEVEW